MPLPILYFFTFLAAGIATGVTILLPFLASAFGLSLSQAGLIRSILNANKILLVFPVLFLAHKFSNRKLLFLSVLIFSIGFILIGVSTSYIMLLFMVTVVGMGVSLYGPISKAELARQTADGKRGQVTSNNSSAGELGKFAISALLGFLVLAIGWRYSTFVFGLVSIVLLTAIIIFLLRKKYTDINLDAKKVSYRKLLSNPQMFFALACSFVDDFASTSVLLFLPFLIQAKNFDLIYLPITSSIMLLGGVFGKFSLGRLTDKKPEAVVFIVSEILMAVLTLTIAFSSNIYIILLIAFFLGIVTKGTAPIVTIMVGNAASEHKDFKSAYSLEIFFDNISQLIAPLVFGFIGDTFGLPVVFIGFSITTLIAIFPGIGYHLHKSKTAAIATV